MACALVGVLAPAETGPEVCKTETRSEPVSKTFGKPRRFAVVSDGDTKSCAAIGYLELQDGEEVRLPIRAVECPEHPGVLIASVKCVLRGCRKLPPGKDNREVKP